MNRKDVERVYIEENKDAAISVMEEYFPNGGQDYDQIVALFNAIVDGKVPSLGVSY